jgi:hypothetical protein
MSIGITKLLWFLTNIRQLKNYSEVGYCGNEFTTTMETLETILD